MNTTNRPCVLVSGNFNNKGGQDKPVNALAEYLADLHIPVHLVGWAFDSQWYTRENVVIHKVPRYANMDITGNYYLSRIGYSVAKEVTKKNSDARVIVNGGNCNWGDINWVHYLHHANTSKRNNAPLINMLKESISSKVYKWQEKNSIPRAKIVIANSQKTAADIVKNLEISPEKIRVVRYGSNPEWGPAEESTRIDSRRFFCENEDMPIVSFVGALGFDNRKGYDTLLLAWKELCKNSDWNVKLLIAGGGKATKSIKEWIKDNGLEQQIRLLGNIDNVDVLLSASDLLVSPTRYEPFGLNVQEAICKGVPVIVTATAGVTEIFPSGFKKMCLSDANDVGELCSRLLEWRRDIVSWKNDAMMLSPMVRKRTWKMMAEEITSIIMG